MAAESQGAGFHSELEEAPCRTGIPAPRARAVADTWKVATEVSRERWRQENSLNEGDAGGPAPGEGCTAGIRGGCQELKRTS